MDPALLCTATGDVEQTISQIQTRGEHGRFIFICVIRIVIIIPGFHPGDDSLILSSRSM
jgi:hypothetical protein